MKYNDFRYISFRLNMKILKELLEDPPLHLTHGLEMNAYLSSTRASSTLLRFLSTPSSSLSMSQLLIFRIYFSPIRSEWITLKLGFYDTSSNMTQSGLTLRNLKQSDSNLENWSIKYSRLLSSILIDSLSYFV